MLRPARWLGRLTSPRQRCAPTGPPVYGRACPVRGLPQPESAITTRPNHLLPRRDSHPLAYQRTKAAPGANRGHRGTLLWLESQGLEISRVGLGRTDTAAHVSPVPSIHSVRWVFPVRLEDGFRRNRAFPSKGLLGFISLSPGLTLSRGLVALAGNPLTVSLVRLCLPSHRPLAQHGLSCPRLQTLLRPDAPV